MQLKENISKTKYITLRYTDNFLYKSQVGHLLRVLPFYIPFS